MPRSSEVKIVPNPVSDVRKQTKSVLRATRETKQNIILSCMPGPAHFLITASHAKSSRLSLTLAVSLEAGTQETPFAL